MVLGDSDISRELSYGDLDIEPLNLEEQLQPCSLDIRLGREFAEYGGGGDVLDVRKTDMEDELFEYTIDDGDGVVIEPDGFYLANTVETFSVPEYLGAEVRGRSSLGRLGIEVHSTAGWVDAGFSDSKIVLEISNNCHSPIRLYPGMRVAQMVFYRLETRAKNPYNGEDNKYQGQTGVQGSKIHDE